MNDVQSELRAHRLTHHLTPFDMYAKLTFPISTILTVERGDPHMSQIRRYCAALGLMLAYEVESLSPPTTHRADQADD